MTPTERITEAWRQDRRYLLAVAGRILADQAEAEDVVQDAFARLSVQRVEDIDDLRAWLVVAVRRIALDRLGSAHSRLSTPTDTFQERDSAPDPADRVTFDEEIRRALGVVLDRLTPAERTTFVLHDVFGIPFDRVAELVGRTPAACRQLATRARRQIQVGELDVEPRPADRRLRVVTERFIAACSNGDVAALAEVLDPDVAGWATLDGENIGFEQGAEAVAGRLLVFLGPHSGWELSPLELENCAAVLATRHAEPVAMLRLMMDGDRVQTIRTVLLPG